MANNLCPSWTILRYHVGTHRHTMTLPCQVDGVPVPGVRPNVQPKASPAVDWGVAVEEFATLVAGILGNTAAVDLAEFWYQPTPADDITFIDALQIGIPGAAAGAAITASENVLTFRTAGRGGLKLYVLEGVTAVNVKVPLPTTAYPAHQAIVDYVTGNDGWITGRNNDYPIVGLNLITKINDVLRDKYLIGG